MPRSICVRCLRLLDQSLTGEAARPVFREQGEMASKFLALLCLLALLKPFWGLPGKRHAFCYN